MSRPARGAWVEITVYIGRRTSSGRAPQGARGLKYKIFMAPVTDEAGRAPQGARGLKLLWIGSAIRFSSVAPRKGRVG